MASKTPGRRRLNRICATLGLRAHRVDGPVHADPGPPVKVLWQLQGRRCYRCNQIMTALNINHPRSPPTDFRTRDHVVPKGGNGGNRGNVLLACEGCNLEKGNRLPWACELIYLAAINAQLEAMGL